MLVQEVWLLLLLTTGSLNVAPQAFATKADCDAVAAQIPKGSGVGRCIAGRILDPQAVKQ